MLDQETQELMVQFYKNVLSSRMKRCQALRQAALQQMQIVKGRYGSPHPFYWGSLCVSGGAVRIGTQGILCTQYVFRIGEDAQFLE